MISLGDFDKQWILIVWTCDETLSNWDLQAPSIGLPLTCSWFIDRGIIFLRRRWSMDWAYISNLATLITIHAGDDNSLCQLKSLTRMILWKRTSTKIGGRRPSRRSCPSISMNKHRSEHFGDEDRSADELHLAAFGNVCHPSCN